MRTQIGIIGAGPAGLLLSHLLALQKIDSVVLEARSRSYVEGRIRAGVLEQGTMDILDQTGAGERMRSEGLLHHGIELRIQGESHRIDMSELTGGRAVMVYAQQEVVRDLIAIRLAAGADIRFEAKAVRVTDHLSDRPQIVFHEGGTAQSLECDFVVGCDGSHGISREAIPPDLVSVYERSYPFAWLGILSLSPPPSRELIYAHHERGFALFSMRSPNVSRLYVQCSPEDDLAAWPDDRVWEELQARLGAGGDTLLKRGQVQQKAITPMRSWVAEPMQHGRLFLAGDAAHIVPPTGAKGLNLAVADVRLLAQALEDLYRGNDTSRLESYSQRALWRVWRAQHFSWWMTTMLHSFADASDFERRLQRAQLDYVVRSPVAAASLAENYTGLPFEA